MKPNIDVEKELGAAIASRNANRLRSSFEDQNGLLVLEGFLSGPLLDSLVQQVAGAREKVNRNYVPGQKKGGSVSRGSLDAVSPVCGAVYRSPALRRFLDDLTGESLQECPPGDPHGYALYHYSEPGDHIGWHYDTSFYRGSRYTMLLGLVANESCVLECSGERGRSRRPARSHSYVLEPGALVLFDGDRLWHRVTPMAEGDTERVVLAMEFVSDPSMSPLWRLISNVKDGVAYFGMREVFFGRR